MLKTLPAVFLGNTLRKFAVLVCLSFAAQASLAAQVIEFYNTNLDNYFITADANEAAQIDNGSAGPGWSRTGNTFNSGGSTSVCRFYGSQSPGPNSHFYTLVGSECDGLKQLQAITPATQKRWNFESLDFVSTPSPNGNCPTGTVPVYRAYNNGFARGVDSNHRITTSLTAIQQVVARGWDNEGVVMCAPPTQLTTPSGFPTNLPAGTYSISWTLCAELFPSCVTQSEASRSHTDLEQFYNMIIAMPVEGPECKQQNNSCTVSHSVTSTPWTGSSFTVTSSESGVVCINGTCVNITNQMVYTFTKV